MRWFAPIALLPLLAACSEQQMCISRATYDLRTVRGFVEEARGNIARGYALVETEVVEIERQVCDVRPDGSKIYCERPVVETIEKRVAIDLDAEAAKLASLERKEAELAVKAESDIAACKAEFPE
ncbi:hypothetical protein [Celeribacter sp.]|uniref:hypothetical protein n=1 Tax=Celeribacter sp. TaxID=1890673 RepID=UPI003A94CEFF